MTAMLRRVLVVDDDSGLLDALPEMISLRLDDVAVDVCSSATRAIERMAAVDYDAVISDIKMPVMDGLALLDECRRIQPDTPVLLITGHGEHDLSLRALRGGAFDFIAKPIDRDYFSAALDRALGVRALRRTVAEQQRTLEAHARELEERVAQRTEELVRANRAKDDFLGMISHEMRTPLTVILGGITILKKRKDSLSRDEFEALLEDAHREAGRLSRMVDDLLVLARAEGQPVTEPEPVSLPTITAKVAEAMRSRTQSQIRVQASGGLPLAAGDPTFFERVLENLISNAAKYGGTDAPIEIGLATSPDGLIRLTVADRGPGVTPEELPLIFDNFYRTPSAEKAAAGHGIGLAVCRRLIEAMSGQITAREREGGGLEMVVTLPAYDAGASAEETLVAVGRE